MAYALLFESNEGAEEKSSSKIIASAQNLLSKKKERKSLAAAANDSCRGPDSAESGKLARYQRLGSTERYGKILRNY